MVARMQIRVDRLVVQVLPRKLNQLLDVLRYALDDALGVDLQQHPAGRRDVMLDGLKVGTDLGLAPVCGRLGQRWFGGGDIALLHRIVRATVPAVRRTLCAAHWQIALSLLQQQTKLWGE